jgi:hypothetical protein
MLRLYVRCLFIFKVVLDRKWGGSNVSHDRTNSTPFLLTLSYPTSDLVRQYDFPVLLRCRKTSDTVFVAFVRPLSETVRRFFFM